ncbi:hypothetical protein ACE1EF_19650 [Saccharicrinis sp. FJH54]
MKRSLLSLLIFNTIINCGFSQNDNGLISEIKGNWITTVIPDSIQINKRVLPWKDIFYGSLALTINDDNTVTISGNMDRESVNYKIIDSSTIELPDFDNSKISYSKVNDLIYFGDLPSSSIYSRMTDDDFTEIIADEDKLMRYIIDLVFDDYLSKDKISKIDYISLGLETYTPFTFDAIGIKNEDGNLDYFGWDIINDTLRFYKTENNYDDDSGFKYFEKGEIDKIIIKN